MPFLGIVARLYLFEFLLSIVGYLFLFIFLLVFGSLAAVYLEAVDLRDVLSFYSLRDELRIDLGRD